MNKNDNKKNNPVPIVGAGLVTLDIIINNGSKTPVFYAGGSCGNILAGLSFLGWESISVSRAGEDKAGKLMIEDLSSNGVNVKYITREPKVETPRIVEKLRSNGKFAKHSFLWHCPSCHAYLPRFRSPTLKNISGILEDNLSPKVYFFDRVSPATLKLAKSYRERGALVFFEPPSLKNDIKFKEAISLSHIVKYARGKSDKNCDSLQYTTIEKETISKGPSLVIKTLGRDGLFYSSNKDNKWRQQKGFRLNKLYDTCGAGDWCTIGFLFFLQELAAKNGGSFMDLLESKDSIQSALIFAQILASLSCSFVGARGLSNSMEQKEILKTIRFIMKNSTDIHLGADWNSGKNLSIFDAKRKRLVSEPFCQVCLLAQ